MNDKVVIDWETAEYLAVLIGQVSWGNQDRRAKASFNLCEAMGTRKMANSMDCFPEGKTR